MNRKRFPAIYVIGSDGFKKQMDVIKVGAGVYRGRLAIGSRQGLFRVRPLMDTPAFPEVGLVSAGSGTHGIRFEPDPTEASCRVHGRTVRAAPESGVRSRAGARWHPRCNYGRDCWGWPCWRIWSSW